MILALGKDDVHSFKICIHGNLVRRGLGCGLVQTSEVFLYDSLDPPSHSLIPGVQVDLEIIVAQRQDTIALPPEVIQRSDGKPFVWGLDPQNRAKKQTIALGLDAITIVEVTAGLKPGDRVIQVTLDTPIAPGTLIQAPPDVPASP